MMRQLLLATRNAHKTREFADILGPEFAVRDLSADAETPIVDETGETFAENAILKALPISKRFPDLVVVADDSGLEVDALHGAPGIYSARYAGPNATDRENVTRLLSEVRRSGDSPPFAARFRCVLALARGGKLTQTFEGVAEGTIVDAPRGAGGFGYDPVFQPEGSRQTFGELAAEEKNRTSHRARAIGLLRAVLLA
jgi:XTP/dITP diphosphohydrolase